MQITTNITLDVKHPGIPPVIDAVQHDENTRYVEAEIMDGGVAWEIPDGAVGFVGISKPDGTYAYYEYDAEGNPAVEASGNRAKFILVPEALAAAGVAKGGLSFYNAAGDKLTTFAFSVRIQPSAVPDDAVASSDYFNLLTVEIAKAIAAAESVMGMTASAETLPSASEATAEVTEAGGKLNLHLGIPAGPQGPAGKPGEQGPEGPQGPAGAPGPNEITLETATTLTGLLAGDGTNIRVAVAGEDYAAARHAPTHATGGTDPVTPSMIGALEYADLSGRESSGTFPSFSGVFEGTELDHVVLYGKSTQDGVPSPEAPVDIVSYEPGELVVSGESASTAYPLTLTLPGIPVDEGGNYTDETGQQYIADTYDVVTGEYVQRVQRLVLDGTEAWSAASNPKGQRNILRLNNIQFGQTQNSYSGRVLSTHYPAAKTWGELIGETDAALIGVASSPFIGIYDPAYNTTDVSLWKTHLAELFAAGTPLTVNYALAEPITTYLTPQQIPAYAPVTNISAGSGYISAKLGQAMAPVQTTPQKLTAQQQQQVLTNLGLAANDETGAVTWDALAAAYQEGVNEA